MPQTEPVIRHNPPPTAPLPTHFLTFLLPSEPSGYHAMMTRREIQEAQQRCGPLWPNPQTTGSRLLVIGQKSNGSLSQCNFGILLLELNAFKTGIPIPVNFKASVFSGIAH